MKRLLFAVMCLLFLAGCGADKPPELVLFDFETDGDLDRIHWKCHTLLSLSTEHATHGEKSLRLELYPSEYPGLSPILDQHDWSGYGALCLDVYNPQERDLKIIIRIDDREDNPDYGDRYNKGFSLSPGMNPIRIPLESLVTSGTGRPLDLDRIYRFLIFMVRPEEKIVLFVDYMRLDKSQAL